MINDNELKNILLDKLYEVFSISTNSFDFLNSDISTLLKTELDYTLKNIGFDNFTKLKNTRSKQKQRWLKKEVTIHKETINIISNSNLDNFLKIAESIKNELSIDKFKSIYNVDSFEKLREQKINELLKWKTTKSILLTQFPFFNKLKKIQKLNCLKSDIDYFIFHFIYEEDICNKYKNILVYPDGYTNIPIDSNKQNVLTKEDKKTILDDKEVYIHDYIIDDDLKFRTLIDTQQLQATILANTALKTFNVTDSKILGYVLSEISEDFIANKKITISITDIVEKIFTSRGSKNIKTVKDSLIKMALIRCSLINKKSNGMVFGLFSNVSINDCTATITVDDWLVDGIINKKNILLYKDKVKNLSDNAQVLAIHLQKLRFYYFKYLHENNTTQQFKINYNMFRRIFYLGKLNKKNFKFIEKLLDELIEQEIICKDKENLHDGFKITFLNLTPQEKRDILSNSDISSFEINTDLVELLSYSD